jgi:hypothetical protein
MIKIKSISDAERGDLVSHNRKLSVISSIHENGHSFIIVLDNGESFECVSGERREIFRLKSKLS